MKTFLCFFCFLFSPAFFFPLALAVCLSVCLSRSLSYLCVSVSHRMQARRVTGTHVMMPAAGLTYRPVACRFQQAHALWASVRTIQGNWIGRMRGLNKGGKNGLFGEMQSAGLDDGRT